MADIVSKNKHVLICHNRTCLKQGADRVFASFQDILKDTPIPGIVLEKTGCLGMCGNGPMVLILPAGVCYDRVKPQEVALIVNQHLLGGVPVENMIYKKFHLRN
jgi:(2Fe-2S) ferredoxin